MEKRIKTIFMGTPEFAVPFLEALMEDAGFDVVGVVTQPDKKVGREQRITPPPIKAEALESDIPVWQPEKVSKFEFPVSDIDLIVVVAYAQIIPESILNMPKYGCINVHGSLLPKYRGASCVQAAIADGEKETGITVMKMDKGLDTGPIIYQEKVIITDDETGASLFAKLAAVGSKVLVKTLLRYIDGDLKPVPQDNSRSSYVGMLKKEDGRIKWYEDAITIERFIRSRLPWPGAWTKIKSADDGKIIKIIETGRTSLPVNDKQLGEVFIHGSQLAVQCGKDALVIKILQLAGKKAVPAEEFMRGYKSFIGEVLD